MRADQRLVLQLPLTELWDTGGPVPAVRERDLSALEIAAMLGAPGTEFVAADLGRHLEWIVADQRFTFWKSEAKPRLIPPDLDEIDLAELPDEYGYRASLWTRHDAAPVVLFECYH